MSIDKWVKNTDTDVRIWCGQEVQPNTYYLIEDVELTKWQNNSLLLVDIANGIAVIARDDSGSNDIVNVNEAIRFLQDSGLIEVITQKEKTDIILRMASGKVLSNATGLAVLDIKVPGIIGSEDGRYVQGGSAWFANHHNDDHFQVHVIDVDNLMGYGAGVQIGTYTEEGDNAGFYAEPDGRVQVSSMGFFGFLPSGVYLRMIGQSGDFAVDSLYMNVTWGKKE